MLQVSVIGNLGADAQVKSKNGNSFLCFNVAHTARVKSSNGEMIDQTQWVSVTMNHYSENFAKYLVRGTKVYVYGKLFSRIWRDNQGISNVGLNVLADIVELCGSKADASSTATPADAPAAPPADAPAAAAAKSTSAASPGKKNDDLPF